MNHSNKATINVIVSVFVGTAVSFFRLSDGFLHVAGSLTSHNCMSAIFPLMMRHADGLSASRETSLKMKKPVWGDRSSSAPSFVATKTCLGDQPGGRAA